MRESKDWEVWDVVASHVEALPTYPKLGCGKLEEGRYEARWGLGVTRIVL
jgi:hypothetical protein